MLAQQLNKLEYRHIQDSESHQKSGQSEPKKVCSHFTCAYERSVFCFFGGVEKNAFLFLTRSLPVEASRSVGSSL